MKANRQSDNSEDKNGPPQSGPFFATCLYLPPLLPVCTWGQKGQVRNTVLTAIQD